MTDESGSGLACLTSLSEISSFILIHVDSPAPDDRFVPGMMISGSGWVVSEKDIQQIAVYLQDRFVCFAQYGQPTCDVATRFPHYPHSDAAGFCFRFRIKAGLELGPKAWVFIEVSTASGGTRRKGVPISIVRPAELDQLRVPTRTLPPGVMPIKISVETANIDASGLLRVSGWAISLFAVQAIALFLGDEELAAPERGLARPDVAANYPEYWEAGACGFRLVQDITAIKTQHPILRARVLAVGGVSRQMIVPIAFPLGRRTITADNRAINLCVDSAAVRSDGLVLAEGWAVAAAGVRAVTVELDGFPLGTADFGGERPDVGNQFPRVRGARRSGFSFNRKLETPLDGEHLLTIEVRDAAGGERALQIPLLVETVTKPNDVAAHLISDEQIRCDIDLPIIRGDRAGETVRGALGIAGWALSPDGIDNVEVFLDDRSLGLAYYGMRREDIAAAFPDIKSALLSGFAFTIPYRMLGEGERCLRLCFTSKTGKVAERAFAVTVAENEETIATSLLRRRISQVEVDLLFDRLALARPLAVLLIVRSSGGEAQARRQLLATLLSLRAQAFRCWRAVIVPAPAESRDELESFLFTTEPALHCRLSVANDPADELPCLGAADLASDTFIAALRAGDTLGVDALLLLASERAADAEADFWYSDDRRVDPGSGMVTAFFKPDWSPELLMATNYVGRAWFASAALVQAAGIGLHDLARASDHDLVLRLTEAARHISHIPRVLLEMENAANDPPERARRAVRGALLRREGEGEVLPGRLATTWRLKRRLKTGGKVSFVIPTCAARGLIKPCVESLRGLTKYKNYEIIVIDNIPESLPDYKKWVRDHCEKVIEIPAEFNWSRFNNIGAGQAEGEFLLFLNDDIEVLDGDWLDTMLEEAQRPEIGVVGPQLLYPDGKVQHAGIFLTGAHGRHAFRFFQSNDPGYFGLALTPRNMIAVTGACMLSRRAAFEHIGGFDEAHSVVNNDLDYCLRMWRAGQRVLYTPFASLVHHELASRAGFSDVYDEARFVSEWRGVFLKGDPFFNPNLSTEADGYALEPEAAEVVYAAHPLIRATDVKHILAVKLDHIGDFITAFSSFRRLKQRFPGARLSVLAAGASRVLATLEPAIDEVIVFDFFHTRSGLGQRVITEAELEGLRVQLAPHHFDLAVDLRIQPDTRPILQYTGARLLAGFEQAGRFPWLDVVLEWEGDTRFVAKRTHVVDRLLHLVEAVAVACETGRSGDIPIDNAQAWTRLLAVPAIAGLPPDFLEKPLVCVHPAVGSDTRQWPEQHFAGLIDLLVGELDLHIALIGGKDEIAVAEKVLANVRHPASVVSLVGEMSLSDLPLLLRVATLYVGNNSGPKHLAAALGTPTVGVHSGVVDATEWGPFGSRAVAIRRKTACSPCYVASASDCHRHLACLHKLRPSDVFDVCRGLLAAQRLSAHVAASLTDRVSAGQLSASAMSGSAMLAVRAAVASSDGISEANRT